MTLLPGITDAEIAVLRERAEAAELDVEAGLFLFPEQFDSLGHELREQHAEQLRARYEAAAAQRPDRTPFGWRCS
jgi:hypothetical protein